MSAILAIFFVSLLSGMLVQCNPDLIPSVPSGSQVFINQPITIQCTTMGSQLLAWQSVEYIGPGQQLTFNLNSMPGDTRTSSVGAVVTFIRVANSNNGVMLQSVLRISVISTFTNFTVTCRNVDTGSEESVTYQTMNANITEMTLLPYEAGSTCPNNNVTIECTARKSQNIQWGSSANIGLSSVMPAPRCSSDAQPQRYNISGIEVISTMHVSNASGLTCCLTLMTQRLPTMTPFYITCTNLDFQVGVNVSFEIAGKCASTTSMPNSATSMITNNTESDSGSNSTRKVVVPEAGLSTTHIYIIAGGGVGGLLAILIIVIFVIATIKVIITKGTSAKTIPAENEHYYTNEHKMEPNEHKIMLKEDA